MVVSLFLTSYCEKFEDVLGTFAGVAIRAAGHDVGCIVGPAAGERRHMFHDQGVTLDLAVGAARIELFE
jgi:hypothetical protein